ncbi:hypothetical protein COT98_00375 [Candidatus Falkowbacteria bacterium CG10_big_fil_rev_8_21_14_0_10_39_9]|uniref:Uncharacterized protein n=1 Tax=Candidatus Falkowbacteria bacterium CG10_big_fil_rev_8_21_14_0_10_39_9 TaxID=1974566 RepID=A0A2M6WR72_9BACT|nr:MAG: hypothetical protein COT98_00375 [Candidatus Falkowbacteria bacterium CG10_big_fil_rev_8_21_14_0_10_39_9]
MKNSMENPNQANNVETKKEGDEVVVSKPVTDNGNVAESLAREELQVKETLELTRKEIKTSPEMALAKDNLLNLGYTVESLDKIKADFSQKTSPEAYTPFEVLALEQTITLLDKYRKDPKNEKDVDSVNMLGKKVRDAITTLKGAESRGIKNAPKAYGVLMDELLEKFGHLKGGYNSVKFYQGFENDLALNVLSAEQQQEIAAMAKASEYKKAENLKFLPALARIFGSSITQKGAEVGGSLYSDRTPEELYNDSIKK